MRLLGFLFLLTLSKLYATDYHVGPGQALDSISQVPWASLQAGDRVFIHWRVNPYKEKWVINRQGTASQRIEIIGVSGPQGQQPVIDGNGAVTPSGLNFWNESRGVIKIGGSNTPPDGLPNYITIENLEIRSGRPAYTFTNDQGAMEAYASNAASIYVEKAANLIIRECTLHDSGNGIFIGAFNGQTENILIEHNYIYDNGISGSGFHHNTYTEALNITYQYNRFGPLRSGADGNNLKDRSAGLLVRYNWIEGGNRQLDLVDAGTSALIINPSYSKTNVYGNILIEPDGAGNSQIIHYGGDSGASQNFRKGELFLYNNTIISTRSGNTTLVRLSTQDETCHSFNNVIYTTASGNKFAMIEGSGTFNMHHNWLKTGWINCHCSPTGIVVDLGNNLTGADPMFSDFSNQEFRPVRTSPLINQGAQIPDSLTPGFDVLHEYIKHTLHSPRPEVQKMDIGSFEFPQVVCTDTTKFMSGAWSNGLPNNQKFTILESDYNSTNMGDIFACSCIINQNVLLSVAPGDTLSVAGELTIHGMTDFQLGSILNINDQE